MLLFQRKKKKEKYVRPDASVHRVFQFGAIALIGFVIYTLYFPDKSVNQVAPVKSCEVDRAKVQAEVKSALDRLSANSDYKRLREFVSMVDNAENKDSRIIDAPNGLLIYVPFKEVDGQNEILISNEKYNLRLSAEKLESAVPSEKNNGPETENKPGVTDEPLPSDFIGPRQK